MQSMGGAGIGSSTESIISGPWGRGDVGDEFIVVKDAQVCRAL